MKPSHLCLSWSGSVELGFDDGAYLSREVAFYYTQNISI